jgi:hypothetical protein
MGRGVDMSWADELRPPFMSLRFLCEEIVIAYQNYKMKGLPVRTRFGFVFLKIVQRLSYYFGWKEGAIRKRF